MKRVLNRILHWIYDVYLTISVYFIKISYRNVKSKSVPKILALPYYPEDWPGGVERFGNWKPHFESKGITYTVHWASSRNEYLSFIDTDDLIEKFLFHFRILRKRLSAIKRMGYYDVVYIQRETIPFAYSNTYKIENLIIENHPNVVYDFYDADYLSTPEKTNYIVRKARKLTVASLFLQQKFKSIGANEVFFSRLCLPPFNTNTNATKRDSVIRIGWMGSPGNSKNLIPLAEVLLKLQYNYPEVVFSFVCRNEINLGIAREMHNMNDPNFDYNSWLSSISIGIVPYMDSSERTLAKTAMKSLEFWSAKVALICSPHGMSDQILHGENCLICSNLEDWFSNMSLAIESRNLRQSLSKNGLKIFEKFHRYESNFESLNEFIFPISARE